MHPPCPVVGSEPFLTTFSAEKIGTVLSTAVVVGVVLLLRPNVCHQRGSSTLTLPNRFILSDDIFYSIYSSVYSTAPTQNIRTVRLDNYMLNFPIFRVKVVYYYRTQNVEFALWGVRSLFSSRMHIFSPEREEFGQNTEQTRCFGNVTDWSRRALPQNILFGFFKHPVYLLSRNLRQ